MIENMIMCYDEVRDVLQTLQILSAAEVDEQVRLLSGMTGQSLPAVWGAFRVTAQA